MTEFETMKIAFERAEEDLAVIQWSDGSALIELETPENTIEFWFDATGKLENIFSR